MEHLDDFFRHYVTRTGEEVKQASVYVAFKYSYERLADPNALELQVKDTHHYAMLYRSLLEPPVTYPPDLRTRLAALTSLETTILYPFLLRLLDAHSTGHIDEGDLIRCLDMIESLVLRRYVCGIASNALNKVLQSHLRSFPSESIAPWLAAALAAGEGTSRWPRDAEFRSALIAYERAYKTKWSRHLLEGIERGYGHKEYTDLDGKGITIEHIMPQQLSDEWRTSLGPDWRRIHGDYVHRLGNLTLTGYNCEMSNASFAVKVEQLKNSHIEMNRWIAECTVWGEEEIVNRAGLLADTACHIWRGAEAFLGQPSALA